MLSDFLYETFRFIKGDTGPWYDEEKVGARCAQRMEQAVDRVTEQISPKLRAIPGYQKRLRAPMAAAFEYIDALAETVPAPMRGTRAGFFDSPELSAFFVNFQHLQEVFSSSRDVRDLLCEAPETEACYALICMDREDRRQLGMALAGDEVRRDVMQTAVSFTNHQVISPGPDEEAARCALKCCMFKALVQHTRRLVAENAARGQAIAQRRAALTRRLARAAAGSAQRIELQAELTGLERQRGELPWPLETLEDRLAIVVDVLGHPERFLASCREELHLDRMGIQIDGARADQSRSVPVSQIQIGGGKPRVALMLSFPRSEVLPETDFLHQAELFLMATAQ